MTNQVDHDFFETFERRPIVSGSTYIDPAARGVIQDCHTVPLVESFASPLVRPSSIHGRNAEDPFGLIFDPAPIYDEFGNYYSAFSIKGADASSPRATFYEIEPSGVRVQGMLDASTFTRCRDVSRELRANGALVEWPIFHARPKLFPDGESDIGLLEFKYMVYGAYLDRQQAIRQVAPEQVDGVGRVGAVAQGLLDMQFGVMYRAMLSNIRLAELPELARKRELNKRVSQTISALQQRDLAEFDAGEIVHGLNPRSPRDRNTYLTTALPGLMGQNLAKTHTIDAYHKYLHPGNWSLGGEIVDLDSVRMPTIFPEDKAEVTTGNKLSEAFGSRHALQEVAKCTGTDPEKLLAIFNEAYRSHIDSSNFTPLELLALEAQTSDLEEYMDSEKVEGPRIFAISLREAASLWYDILETTHSNMTVVDGDDFAVEQAASDQFIDTLAKMAEQQITNVVADSGTDCSDWLPIELAAMHEAAKQAKQVYFVAEDYIQTMVAAEQAHSLQIREFS